MNVGSLFRRLTNFDPYESVMDVTQLVMSAGLYKQFLDKLEDGLGRGLESGGVLTVRSGGSSVDGVNIYSVPDEFRSLKRVRMGDAWQSEWRSELEKELVSRGERVGFEYHTHAIVTAYPQTSHEEWKTSLKLRHKHFGDKKIISLGDIIIERIEDGNVALHGYTPASEPWIEKVTGEYARRRVTHSLEILVPQLGKRFALPLG
jgi:hypothetical protein